MSLSLDGLLGVLILLITLAAIINYKVFKLPEYIGILCVTLILSVLLIILGEFGLHYDKYSINILKNINFTRVMGHYIVNFVLFAGAMHLHAVYLHKYRKVVINLAVFGTIISTVVLALIMKLLSIGFGFNLTFIHCLLFGSLISPTDPVAIISIIKKHYKNYATTLLPKLSGESLFNDLTAVTLFVMFRGIMTHDPSGSFTDFIVLFLAKEVIGGIIIGLIYGGVAYFLIKKFRQLHFILFITLSIVIAGDAFADFMHFSGEIAIAISGLIVGLALRPSITPAGVTKHLEFFWSSISQVLHALLFVLIGLLVLFIQHDFKLILLGLIFIVPSIIVVRYCSILFALFISKHLRHYNFKHQFMLTWSGIKGGVSISLALSLPNFPHHNIIIAITYTVVLFSIIVQGLSLNSIISKIINQKVTA